MANNDVRICPQCKTVYIEDDSMYEDVDVCPHCGADVTDDDAEIG